MGLASFNIMYEELAKANKREKPMDISKLKTDQLKAKLDSLGIPFEPTAKKQELISLLENGGAYE